MNVWTPCSTIREEPGTRVRLRPTALRADEVQQGWVV